MIDLINSLEKKLLEFDKESIERDLTRREKKERENIKYEIFWAKFKKFKADFERLIFNDFKELTNSLKAPLLEKNILLKIETHKTRTTRYFGPDFPIYMILSITHKSFSLVSRWESSPFLLIKGNHENHTIELYDCNQDQADVSSIIKKNVWVSPIEHFKIDEYKFSLLEPLIETWLNRNLDRILNSESYKKKYKIA